MIVETVITRFYNMYIVVHKIFAEKRKYIKNY